MITLPPGYRFRVGAFKRVILQRFETWEDEGRAYGQWVDARLEHISTNLPQGESSASPVDVKQAGSL